MLRAIILKTVISPARVLMASPRATALSCIFSFGVLLYARNILGTILVFLCIHALMISLTRRDPYFMETIIARLRCGKTKNFKPTKGNRYEP